MNDNFIESNMSISMHLDILKVFVSKYPSIGYYDDMEILKRDISKFIRNELIKIYPVITITGPRQSGKTTLVKELFPHKPYINLERLDEREFALADPARFLKQFPEGVVLDEVQRVPELLSYIQAIVDEEKIKAKFILTGSQNFALLDSISQSLAGRTAIVNLLPFSLSEIVSHYKSPPPLESLLYQGFYPRIYDEKAQARIILSDYIQTYLEKDLRDWSRIQDLNLFRKFLKMCAARIGQVLNTKNIADDLGLSHVTIKKWINLLELSFIVYLLPPFSANINKQLIKSPKLYFYDVGLASHLLDIERAEQLITHSMRGSLFENLVIVEFLKHRFNSGRRANLYFYKDKTKEIDLIYKDAENLSVIEIKSSDRIKDEYFNALEYFGKLFPREVSDRKYIVYSGDKTQSRSRAFIMNYGEILKSFEQ